MMVGVNGAGKDDALGDVQKSQLQAVALAREFPDFPAARVLVSVSVQTDLVVFLTPDEALRRAWREKELVDQGAGPA